jgi:16S rRNA (guanine1207-N2)-methyltransferase
MNSPLDSLLVKKRVSFNFSKVSLQLDLSESLFSSFDVDLGTKALLNSLRKNENIDYSRTLDLGCGTGPVGLFLKAQDSSREVHMVDRDALAVTFALHNAELNRLDVKVYPSLDYESVEGKFSLIATNFPAKMSTKGLQTFVYGASRHLSENGVFALVVVRELGARLERVLARQPIRVLYREDKKQYYIRHIAFDETIDAPTGKYERGEMKLSFSKMYTVKTAFGLPEFDRLSFATKAAAFLLKDMDGCSSVFVLEPGQGHSSVAIMDSLAPKNLTLASRDLLSLVFAERNVKANFNIQPDRLLTPYLQNPPDAELIIWSIMRKKDKALIRINSQALLKGNVPILLCSEEAVVRRLLDKAEVTVLAEKVIQTGCACLMKPAGL